MKTHNAYSKFFKSGKNKNKILDGDAQYLGFRDAYSGYPRDKKYQSPLTSDKEPYEMGYNAGLLMRIENDEEAIKVE